MTAIVGLASNRGRHLLSIHHNRPGDSSVDGIISDREDAPILAAAEKIGIPAFAVEPEPNEPRESHEERLLDVISDLDVDLVCLDGYEPVISGRLLDSAPPVLNVHGSLLPAFRSTEPVNEAIEAGVSITGSTVHAVTDATNAEGRVVETRLRTGRIITQEPVAVQPDDTRESLHDRIHRAGTAAYLRAVRWVSTGDVEFERGTGGELEAIISDDSGGVFPAHNVGSEDRRETLRYGENPHQSAALYGQANTEEPTVVGAQQVSGDTGMSYVNYLDAAGGLDLILEFERPAAAVIKHANPAGCAIASTLSAAYDRALSTDPMSAFGGVVSLNRPCDRETAEAIIESVKHVVVAPGFEDGVLDILSERESMRVLDVSNGRPGSIGPADRGVTYMEQSLVGGRLVQDRDLYELDREDLEIVTDRCPNEGEIRSMIFAWPVVKHATSNAIALVTGSETVGIGIGQVSRVDAVRIATLKADEHAMGKDADGSVMASDAFFPFPDGVEVAAESGISAIVQPGGSMRDDEVIDAANEHDIAMAFTGTRCFRHG